MVLVEIAAYLSEGVRDASASRCLGKNRVEKIPLWRCWSRIINADMIEGTKTFTRVGVIMGGGGVDRLECDSPLSCFLYRILQGKELCGATAVSGHKIQLADTQS